MIVVPLNSQVLHLYFIPDILPLRGHGLGPTAQRPPGLQGQIAHEEKGHAAPLMGTPEPVGNLAFFCDIT